MNERQRREALGVGLLALGVLVTLALVPQMLPGRAGSGNLIGPAGQLLSTGLRAVFGVASALVALPAFVWALWGFGTVEKKTAIRWSVLSAGAMLFLPAAWWFVTRALGTPGAGAGWLGEAMAGVLTRAFGTVGAQLIVAAFVAALVVLTMGVSPIGVGAAAGRGARWIGNWAWRGLRAAGAAVAAVWTRWRERESAAGPDPSLWERSTPVEPVEAVASPPVDRRAEAATEETEAEEEDGETVEPLPDYGDTAEEELPPLELLKRPARTGSGIAGGQLERLGQVLVDKLATFRVDGSIGGWTTGPVVTQFEVIPAEGVKVGQIAALADDLALALKAPSVRIVAPIPGKGAVGVEIPNPEPEIVKLREILESPVWQNHRGALPLGLGRDLDGNPYVADLAKMPHLLIAGATGSGKSVCINTIITSLVYRYSPNDLRLLMIDPKMVELIVYNDLPHLRHPVVTDNHDAAAVLRWTVHEMGRRYRLLSANSCRNLVEINRRIRTGDELQRPDGRGPYEEGVLPYIVLVIDELADLMMTVQGEVETPLAILAQKARAVGIHLVVATQRPSVNVITGLIKANFPCRIAFRVASKTDSRTIIDQNGAESLLGNGDMLFLEPAESDPHRIQGAYLDTLETERLIAWYRDRAAARAQQESEEQDILEEVRELEIEESQVDVTEEVMADWDPYFRKAAEIVIHNDAGSTSLLQRRLKIGYGRAARIIDQLHDVGVLGPPDGSRPREVLVSLAQLDAVMQGDDLRAEAETAAGATPAPDATGKGRAEDGEQRNPGTGQAEDG